MKTTAAFLFPLMMLAQAQVRPNLPPVPRYEVKRASAPVAVDGSLDDPAWRDAAAVEFVFPWEQQTGAKQKTRVKLLWDSNYLYLGYECEDTDVVAIFTERDDPTYRDDAVELFINPNPARNSYLGFEMNARGVMYDYFMIPGTNHVTLYQAPGYRLVTSIRGTLNQRGAPDQGWTLELAIPWKAFSDFTGVSLPPKPGEVWRANLNRWDGVESARRLSQWSDSGLERPNPHNPQRFGELAFRE
jgi:hypothetical protein